MMGSRQTAGRAFAGAALTGRLHNAPYKSFTSLLFKVKVRSKINLQNAGCMESIPTDLGPSALARVGMWIGTASRRHSGNLFRE